MVELNLLEETSKLLNNIGKSKLAYVTAEFAPFSDQQRPDLLFYPSSKRYVDFIEYKLKPSLGFSKVDWNAFKEKKIFVEESSEVVVHYIFATNVKIGNDVKKQLSDINVNVFDEIITPTQLYNAIYENELVKK